MHMKTIFAAILVMTAAHSLAEDAPLTDSDVWNKGVEEYLAGNATNALETLRPITLSRTHGPRASEVVGAIEAGIAGEAMGRDDVEGALKAYESSAEAMQRTLRAEPDDDRAMRNFIRAADKLPALRSAARTRAAMKAAEGKSPDALVGAAHREALSIMKAQDGVLTNAPAAAISASEELARRADALSDSWDPLRGVVEASVTNSTQLAELLSRIEGGKAATIDAAEKLADLDPNAASAISSAESSLHDFWLAVVLPPESIAAGIQAQTNAYTKAETENSREWNGEALKLTGAFRSKFPMWASMYEQQAQSDTNKPPFTAEAQAEISALATEVEKLQLGLANPTPATVTGWASYGMEESDVQTNVIAKLQRIQDLMPKDGGGGSGAQEKSSGQDSQPQAGAQQPEADEDEEKDSGASKSEDGEDEPKEAQAAKAEPRDEDAEQMMDRAQRRSDEHEAEKKAAQQRLRLSPNEKDW